MGTIPSYPAATVPLTPDTVLAGWQNGGQVAVPITGFAAPGDVAALKARVDVLTAPRGTIAADPVILEVGSTANVTITWNLTAGPASQGISVNGGAPVNLAPGLRTYTLTDQALADRNVVLAVADAEGNGSSLDVTVLARLSVYAGIVLDPATTDRATVLALASMLDNAGIARRVDFNLSRTGYAAMFFDAGLTIGAARYLSQIADPGTYTISTPFDFTNGSGATRPYRRFTLNAPLDQSATPLTLEFS